MSGGRNHVAKGGMSSKLASDADSSQTLKAYEKESEEATKQLEEALQNLRGIEAEVENLGKSGPQIMKINLNIQGCSRRMAEDHLSPKRYVRASQSAHWDIQDGQYYTEHIHRQLRIDSYSSTKHRSNLRISFLSFCFLAFAIISI